MGMFDEVNCQYPLPGVEKPSGTLFQTKDLDCTLSVYTITPEGRLICDKWHYEVVPESELPDPRCKFIGSLRRKVDAPNVDQNYHGLLNFYGDDGDFVAKFTDGKVVEIVREEEQP